MKAVTESKWLAGEDIEAMVNYLVPGGGQPSRVSDRVLRYWVEACRRHWVEACRRLCINDVAIWPELTSYQLCAAVRAWSQPSTISTPSVPPAERAAFLRDVVGNQFRRVVALTPIEVCVCPTYDRAGWVLPVADRKCERCGGKGYTGGTCPWRTPTVVSLARAAYDERKRACDICDGAKEAANHRAGEVRGSACPSCGDSGEVEDGTLDPVRLAVLADALEEAGCGSAELLQHLRSPGRHVIGCWAVDLLFTE